MSTPVHLLWSYFVLSIVEREGNVADDESWSMEARVCRKNRLGRHRGMLEDKQEWIAVKSQSAREQLPKLSQKAQRNR